MAVEFKHGINMNRSLFRIGIVLLVCLFALLAAWSHYGIRLSFKDGHVVLTRDLSSTQIAKAALGATAVVEADSSSLGSGVVIADSGIVLTCYHVIEDASSISVKLANGGSYQVKGLCGYSRRLDIAALKIAGKGLTSLKIGDSASLKPGDRVVAIGNPQGLENTVSEGIVSAIRTVDDFPPALKRELMENGRDESDILIQFTAPVSPGSSGGPLLDRSGRLVGVVEAGVRSADSIYFAVPINEAKRYITPERMTALPSSRLKSRPAPPEAAAKVVVNTPKGIGLPMRIEPSQYADRVAGRDLVSQGESVIVLDRFGDWLYVRTRDGMEGYIRWYYLGDCYVRPSSAGS